MAQPEAGYSLALSEAEIARYRFMAEAAVASEGELWAAAGVVEGAVVADVGCGPGAVSAVLARLVGPTGRVWAVERDEAALAAARALADQAGLGHITFRQGEATCTGLEPGAADTVMMRHVLAHNGGAEEAIVEHLATLVRPGGCVYLVDIEASAIRMRPSEPAMDDLGAKYQEFHARQGNDLSVGLRLGELLVGAGLELVDHRGTYSIVESQPGLRPPSWAAREAMVAAGVASAGDVERWSAAFDEIDRRSVRFTLFVPLFCATGRRPMS